MDIDPDLLTLEEPQDYFKGLGQVDALPTPRNILLFMRRTRECLQQEALQNRSHHRHVLILNLETTGHVQLNHLLLQIRPGQGLLILPYQFHHFCQIDLPQLSWLFCTFELTSSSFLEPFRNRVFNVNESSGLAFTRVLEGWRQMTLNRDAGGLVEWQFQADVVSLLLACRESLPTVETDRLGSEEGMLGDIHRVLSEWRGKPIRVADVADRLGLSESYLRARFRDAAGVSLGSYIQNYRIHRAMELLRTTDLLVSEIAVEAGFGSSQAFNRTFKQQVGQTPRAYRHGD